MSRQHRVGVLVRMPPVLKSAAVERADAEGRSVNDVLVAALSRRYGVRFHPTNRRSRRARRHNGDVLLRMPPELRRKIQQDVTVVSARTQPMKFSKHSGSN